MLVVDELKKNDPQLRLLALLLAGGLFILLSGLWWVQVVSAKEYQNHLEMQAYRTIRLPGVRGKILDREGRVLAENQARYNLSLYFDDLNDQFKKEYDRLRPVKVETKSPPFWMFWSHAKTVTTNRVRLDQKHMDAVMWQARYNVVNRIMWQVGQRLGQPLALDFKKFVRSYQTERAMPFTILTGLDGGQIARFQENYAGGLGADLEMESVRSYPLGTTAAHLLGELRQDDSSLDGEESFFNYRLPDYRGETGIEGKFNSELHGHAGGASVKVNSMGFRQSEEVDVAPVPGQNVTLTVDLDLQRAAEAALAAYGQRRQVSNVNGAVVVMDVHTGDVLALASSPTFDPNNFAQGWTPEKYRQFQESNAEKNRAIYENYQPGSIFKTVVALAALEGGLNPQEIYHVEADPSNPVKGYYNQGGIRKKDTAPPGDYNFKKAFIHSSNAYFINYGLKAGVRNILRYGEEFHLGERTGVLANQETKGNFPTLQRVQERAWRDGDTANLCIGQGEIDVTPIQMAVMISAIANGGTVLWPRLVSKIEPQDPAAGEVATNFPAGRVRDRLTVHQRSLAILRDAMLDDVASPEGSGRDAKVNGLSIGAKTGTAQVQDERNRLIGHNYWFASFAPFESPKYAVVVLIQSATEGGSGGTTCGPIAHDVYEEILKKETAPKVVASAK